MADQHLIRPVYLNASSSFFPNAVVDNDAIETILGSVGNRVSRSKKIILESNKIKTRYYAIDPVTRKPTHTNAQMTALAVEKLISENPELKLENLGLLACGTSSPDLLLPAHGQMVQGELKDGQLKSFDGEVITMSGVCCSGTAALKSAIMSLRCGDHSSAIVTGSEAASKGMRGEFFDSESDAKIAELQKSPMVAFEHDFLRWMLSDGAAALYLSTEAIPGKQNFRINWIEGRSFSNVEPVCMMCGGARGKDGSVTGWRDLRVVTEERQKFVMNIQQDIRQLRDRAPELLIEKTLGEIKKRRGLNPGDYSYYLPHFSSDFFREVALETMKKIDFAIPEDRWFTSLYDRGNIGSAAIFVTIDELRRQKKLNVGDKMLCFVPESARMSVYYFELEVV